jgi:hypothetical protein
MSVFERRVGLHGLRLLFNNDFFLFAQQEKKAKKRHISFCMTMMKAVYSYSEYAGYVSASNTLEIYVPPMERGFFCMWTR